ncbi:nuclease [Sphingobacterium sp. SGG-5]|uniref:thermonuclease family protein n=1 Tax=Sphingobacterium sp. SGG-5 TaxID=2710881 RepID=UPI0013E9C27D|nr:thermonuclease family protein [Sphingobacterium sp. SGG-5]NGM62055.1 nuclease [Sphingobacterium sp. SGG-5]
MSKIIIIITLFATTISCQSINNSKKDEISYYHVTKVVDGDTFWANGGTERDIKVRLIGIDAPETRKTGRKEIGYYGIEAKDYLTKLLSGQSVRLVGDVDSLDRYGRTLAYVYLKDGTFVNAELLQKGYAVVLTIPPNVKHSDLFQELQKEARMKKRGLWRR